MDRLNLVQEVPFDAANKSLIAAVWGLGVAKNLTRLPPSPLNRIYAVVNSPTRFHICTWGSVKTHGVMLTWMGGFGWNKVRWEEGKSPEEVVRKFGYYLPDCTGEELPEADRRLFKLR